MLVGISRSLGIGFSGEPDRCGPHPFTAHSQRRRHKHKQDGAVGGAGLGTGKAGLRETPLLHLSRQQF